MKRIENSQARNVSFINRRKDIIKRAESLSKLCNLNVHFIAFSPDGEPYASTSSNGRSSDSDPSLDAVVDKFLKDHQTSSSDDNEVSCFDSVVNKTEPKLQVSDGGEVTVPLMDVDINKLTLSEIREYRIYLQNLKSQVAEALEKKKEFEDQKIGEESSFVEKDEVPMIVNKDCDDSDQTTVCKGAADEIDDQKMINTPVIDDQKMINTDN